MEQQRGRSPSGGHQFPVSHAQSPDHHGSPANNLNLGLSPDGSGLGNNDVQAFANANYNSNQNLSFDGADFLSVQQTQGYPQASMENVYNQSQTYNPQNDFNQYTQENIPNYTPEQAYRENAMNANNFGAVDYKQNFDMYNSAAQNTQFDPSYFVNETLQQNLSQSVNPQDLLSDISSPLSQTAHTPPHMLGPEAAQIGSARQSPAFNQNQFTRSPGHSRHASLGPESAAFPNAQIPADWSGMMPSQFTAHRRSPSEFSDVSSIAPSPGLQQHETFDDLRHSPLMNPQDSGMYADGLGIGTFSISDPSLNQASGSIHGGSPAHTPAMSPRIGAQQPAPLIAQNEFLLNFGINPGAQVFNTQYNENENRIEHRFMERNPSAKMGQAQQMVPPQIEIEFAPASRQNSFEPPLPARIDQDGLLPPERGRGRRRAVSDLTHSNVGNLTRPSTPGALGSSTNSNGLLPSSGRSLSASHRPSSSSPNRRRQSTSALPNRDHILKIADPNHEPISGTDIGNPKRVQKHPATFQCTLCPKRFTRAYNLRSHLRTHTDERPFVCTVCGKAFARQHDRKRHEGLHSGEKKFVCKGELLQGGQWGCGRRFARADALGRHFRSEAGRVCIKPLLDEEAVERQRLWQEQHMQNMAQNMQQPQSIAMDVNGFPMTADGGFTLPAALLAQYPALAGLSWNDLPQEDVGMEEDLSGRSSFDASGSEYYDEGGDDGYLSSGQNHEAQQFGQNQQTFGTGY